MTRSEIAMIIKASREKAGLTQKQAADAIHRKRQTLASWETGQSQPDANTLFELFDVYGISVNEAFGFDGKISLSAQEHEHIKNYRQLTPLGQRAADEHVKLLAAYQKAVEKQTSDDMLGEFANVIELPFTEYMFSAGTGAYLGPEAFKKRDVVKNDLTRRASFAGMVYGDSMEPKYHDGDFLLVDSKEQIEIGDIGVFTLNGEGYVKKLARGALVSLNHAYDPIPLNDTVRCNGKVIGVLRTDWIIG